MVTYANNLSQADQKYTAIITIEGVGHWLSAGDLTASASDGLTQFSYEVPYYADTTLAIHRPYLAEEVDVLSERVASGGGFPELGSLDFAIVDVDDYLTAQLRTRRTPATVLNGAVTAAATQLTVDSTTGMTASDADGGVLYIGSEAMKVVSVDSGTLVTVVRGYLGTRAVPHADDAPVRFSIPYLGGREVTLKLVPQDADDVSEETQQATYALDRVSWDSALNVWQFSAKSRLKYLHRQAPLAPLQGKIEAVNSGRPSILLHYTSQAFDLRRQWSGTEGDSDRQCYLKVGEEVLAIGSHNARAGTITDRGLLRSKIQDPIEVGTPFAQVFLADLSKGAGSFRYNTNQEASRSAPTVAWTQTDHWVDICLCVMTSSADDLDGYDGTANVTGSYANYACLPSGFGLGLPADRIDWASWMDVKARTLDYRFPYFVYGDRPMPFGQLIEEHFLKPMGAYLSIEAGTAKIILPRLPLVNEASVTIGPANILAQEVGRRRLVPRIKPRLDLVPPGSITYEVGPDKVQRTYKNQDFAQTYGGRNFYDADDKGTTIPVPSGDPAFADVYRKRAASRIYRQHVPLVEIELDLFMDKSTLAVGDLAELTLAEMPDMSAGTRDWTSVVCEKLEGEVRVPLNDCAHVATRLRGYGPGSLVAKVCPSAYITAVSTNTATVSANRYTESDATGGLPTTDAAAFAVGDVVRLVALDGQDTGGGTQVITGISGNDITLDGNFSANLTTGEVLVYAGFDDVDTSNGQDTDFAYMSDRSTTTKGTSGEPNVYGEV